MRGRLRDRAPWALVGLLLAVMACAPEDLPPRFYREDFETLCEGVPCGWSRTTGNDDQAIWVETIHPGEHGLRLTGEVSVRGAGAMGEEPVLVGAMQVQLDARCDLGSELRVDLVVADELGNQVTGSAAFAPPAEWEAPLIAPPSFASAPLSGTVSRVVAIGIAKTGAGACEISDVAIDESFGVPGC